MLEGGPGLRQNRGRPPAMEMAIDQGAEAPASPASPRQRDPYRMVGFYPMMAAAARIDRALLQQRPDHLAAFMGKDADPCHHPFSVGPCPPGRSSPSSSIWATSIVAGGKLRLAGKKGAPIPADWPLDRTACPPRTRTRPSFHGFSSGAGAYKGFRDSPRSWKCWAGCLGRALRPRRARHEGFGKEPLVTSASTWDDQSEAFMPLDQFCARVDRLVRPHQDLGDAGETKESWSPASSEFRRKTERLRGRHPADDVVARESSRAGQEYHVPFELS